MANVEWIWRGALVDMNTACGIGVEAHACGKRFMHAENLGSPNELTRAKLEGAVERIKQEVMSQIWSAR